MYQGPRKKSDGNTIRGVHVRLALADQAALRAEALRRVQAGEAGRIDVSRVLRDLVASWRARART